MKPAVVEQDISEQLVKHASADEMVGELGELAEVEPGQVTVLVKVDQRLTDDLPVGLACPARDPELGPLLLCEVVWLGPALAPCTQEKLGQMGVKMRNYFVIRKISFLHSVIKLFVRPAEK